MPTRSEGDPHPLRYAVIFYNILLTEKGIPIFFRFFLLILFKLKFFKKIKKKRPHLKI